MKRRQFIMASIMAAIYLFAYGGGKAYLTVKVIDAMTGSPIPNMCVHGGFENVSPGWGIASKDNNDDGLTDCNGFCCLSGRTEVGHSCCIVRGNAGYYNSGWYSFDYQERSILKLGRWMPDNVVVTVRLDRIINPIPLYVKHAVGEHRKRDRSYYEVRQRRKDLSATNDVPVLSNAKMAYDLLKGTWMPPHGEGERADVEFTFNEEVLGWKETMCPGGIALDKKYRIMVSIVMPGDGNGLFEVIPDENAGIKLRTAPLEGYVNNLTRWRGWFGGGDGTKTDCDKRRCYAFRIRTVYDKEGNIKNAYYGKFYDDFDLVSHEGVEIHYYLNPTSNNRNLEWDMKNNLCPNPGDIGNPRP